MDTHIPRLSILYERTYFLRGRVISRGIHRSDDFNEKAVEVKSINKRFRQGDACNIVPYDEFRGVPPFVRWGDAFSGLKSIQGLPRTSGHPDSRKLLVNFMAIDHLYRFER